MVPTLTVPKLNVEDAADSVVEERAATVAPGGVPPPHALLAISITVKVVRSFTMLRVRLSSQFVATLGRCIQERLFTSYRAVSKAGAFVNRCRQCISCPAPSRKTARPRGRCHSAQLAVTLFGVEAPLQPSAANSKSLRFIRFQDLILRLSAESSCLLNTQCYNNRMLQGPILGC